MAHANEPVPAAAHEVAGRVARGDWQPAAIYIVDIADIDGEARVLELNPFSGADLYSCDPHAVVEAVPRVAR